MKLFDMISDEKKSKYIGITLVILSFILMGISAYIIAAKTDINVKYTGDMWYETHDTTLPGLPAIEVPDNSRLSQIAVTDEYVYGSDPQLAALDAGVCSDDNWFYMADPANGRRLCRIRKSDLTGYKMLSSLPIRDINVMNGKLYFTTATDSDDGLQGIYVANTDGSDTRLLKQGDFYDLQMMNDRLYYIRGYDRCLLRMDMDGRGEVMLAKEECRQLLVAEGKLYVIICDKSGEEDTQNVICCMDADGEERTNLTEYGCFDALGYTEGKLYYAEFDKGYAAIDISDDGSVSVNNTAPVFIRLKGLHSIPVLKENRLWYIDRLSANTLTAFDTESSERLATSLQNVTSFYVLDDILVVSWLDSEGRSCITTCYIDKDESVKLFGSK